MTASTATGASLIVAAAFAGCTWGGALPGAGGDRREATVTRAAEDGEVGAVWISHYHGATVVRDVAIAPPDIALLPGDRVFIDHQARPPRVLGIVRPR